MGINYEDLTTDVRQYMLLELEMDIQADKLYISTRLTTEGVNRWPGLLREAFDKYDDDWLARQLRSYGLLRESEQRSSKRGIINAKVPYTAPEILSEGEFNRFYARGLCRCVLEMGGNEVEVYRGKTVKNPRPDSQAMIGRRLLAHELLEDLRNSQGVEPSLGLPSGPNSGLTIRMVEH